MSVHPFIPELSFSRAGAYRNWVSPHEAHETSGRYFPYTERHLQAVWFDDHLRPKNLKTVRGEPVIVENPGRWNLEAGPDFHGATLLIGRERRRIIGDAEVHIFASDWKNHQHGSDPRYAQVRVHITWFSGQLDESLFPPGTIQVALQDVCTVDLDSVDLSAYPYAEPRSKGTFPWAGMHPEQIVDWLERAGEERLRQKTVRMAWLMQVKGDAQTLYEETAVALGYKQNKAPFRMLAQRVPLERLAAYGKDWKTVYAVLLGLSGLLPRQPGANWPAESKQELRELWDRWWHEQHLWEEVTPLTRSEWNLANLRPLNHPLRRLCALAQWVAAGFFEHRSSHFGPVATPDQDCFWSTYLSWTGKKNPAELVGVDRAQAIFLNVMVPYHLAKRMTFDWQDLPVEPMNSVIRESAFLLFGPDHSSKLYRTALARQGLIQVFNDFILTGRMDDLVRPDHV